MELSILCGVKVYMIMLDLNEKRLLHYQTEMDDILYQLKRKDLTRELYTNEDVSLKYTQTTYIVSKTDKEKQGIR